MSQDDDAAFERRLADLLTTPDDDARNRDFVSPILARVAARDGRRRFVLVSAGLAGAAATGGIVGMFWPQGAFARLLSSPLSGHLPGGLGIFDTGQGGLWAAALLTLAVIAGVGLGGSVRET